MALFNRKNRSVIDEDEPHASEQLDTVQRLTNVQDTLDKVNNEIEEIKEQVELN